MTFRERFVSAMEGLLGMPVLWGAKGPDAFDCSGAVTASLRSIGGPDLTHTDNAQALHNKTRLLSAEESAIPGDLVFYGLTGPEDIEHVAVYHHQGGVMSADGATPHILTLSQSLANPANRVRVHNTTKYRSDTKYIAVHRNTIVDKLDGVEQ